MMTTLEPISTVEDLGSDTYPPIFVLEEPKRKHLYVIPLYVVLGCVTMCFVGIVQPQGVETKRMTREDPMVLPFFLTKPGPRTPSVFRKKYIEKN